MSNALEYKGYQGIVGFRADDNVLFGKIFGINDLVTFEGNSVNQLKKSFREAVDDYLTMCNEVGKEPERPYKGKFNVRINPEIHRKAAFKAQSLNISLNELVENAIVKEVEGRDHVSAEALPEKSKMTSSSKKSSSGRQKLAKRSSGVKRISISPKK